MKLTKAVAMVACLVLVVLTFVGCTPPPETHNLPSAKTALPMRNFSFSNSYDVKSYFSAYHENFDAQFVWLDLSDEEILLASEHYPGAVSTFSLEYDKISWRKFVGVKLSSYYTVLNPSDLEITFLEVTCGRIGSMHVNCVYYPKTTIGEDLDFELVRNELVREGAAQIYKIDFYVYDGETKVAEFFVRSRITASAEEIETYFRNHLVVLGKEDAPLLPQREVSLTSQTDLLAFAYAYKQLIGRTILLDLDAMYWAISDESSAFNYEYMANEYYVKSELCQSFTYFASHLHEEEITDRWSYKMYFHYLPQEEIIEALEYRFFETENGDCQYVVEIWSGNVKVAYVLVDANVDFNQEWFEEFLNDYLVIV